MNLAGEPLICRIIERLKRCQSISNIVLAIPDTPENWILSYLGKKLDIDIFTGSEDNVMSRFYSVGLKYKSDFIVRFPADNCTPEPSEIDKIVNHNVSLSTPSFSSNLAQVFGNGYPDGIGAEVIPFPLLEHAWHGNPSSSQLEHTHLNFYDYSTDTAVNPELYPVTTINCPTSFSRPDIVLDVNTLDQYLYMSSLYDYLYERDPLFTIADIIKWHDLVYLS